MKKNKPSRLQLLAYHILSFFLKAVALLPFGMLYVLSTILTFPVHRVFRYRLNVVRTNLSECFPEMDKRQRRAIEKKFYRNLCDYVFETIKLFHISDREIVRRMTFSNVELMDNVLAQNRSIVIYFSHTGNWEWATSVRLHSRFTDRKDVIFGQIYRPLRNGAVDRVMLDLRNRFETTCIKKTEALRYLLHGIREGKIFEVGFMSDQKPSHGDPVRILNFMGRPTAVITGTETLARKLDTAVFYWNISKPDRGRYHIDVIPMSDSAAATKPGELTLKYFGLLERNITQSPDLWLWSHKRWKNSPASWAEVSPDTILEQ